MENQIRVFDGSDHKAMKIGEIYGNSYNKEWRSISSSSEKMFIEIHKVKERGDPPIAELRALIKYNNFIPYCKNWLDHNNNTLTCPETYDKNFNCSWLLSAKFGSYIILHIDDIYVSSNLQ